MQWLLKFLCELQRQLPIYLEVFQFGMALAIPAIPEMTRLEIIAIFEFLDHHNHKTKSFLTELHQPISWWQWYVYFFSSVDEMTSDISALLIRSAIFCLVEPSKCETMQIAIFLTDLSLWERCGVCNTNQTLPPRWLAEQRPPPFPVESEDLRDDRY